MRKLLACHNDFLELSAEDDQGMTPLHYVAWSSKSTVADIESFLANDVSCLFKKDNKGRSMLFFAVERGNIAILEHILRLPTKPDLYATDSSGMSLMHYAVQSKRVQTISILLDHGCNVNAVDKYRQAPLHHAVKAGNLEAIKVLLRFKCTESLNKTDHRGQTPLSLAESHGKMAIIEYIRSVTSDTINGTDTPKNPILISDLGYERRQEEHHDSFSKIRAQKGWMTPSIWGILIKILALVILAYGPSYSLIKGRVKTIFF